MTIKIIHIHNCDRCKEDFDLKPNYSTPMITGLVYMVTRNGSGSRLSDMDYELCDECSDAFLHFMKGN